jgi:hypothetical protein
VKQKHEYTDHLTPQSCHQPHCTCQTWPRTNCTSTSPSTPCHHLLPSLSLCPYPYPYPSPCSCSHNSPVHPRPLVSQAARKQVVWQWTTWCRQCASTRAQSWAWLPALRITARVWRGKYCGWGSCGRSQSVEGKEKRRWIYSVVFVEHGLPVVTPLHLHPALLLALVHTALYLWPLPLPGVSVACLLGCLSMCVSTGDACWSCARGA